MRLVKRQEFLAMPAGTFYAEAGEYGMSSDGLEIKGDTTSYGDFWSHDFTGIAAHSSDEHFDRGIEMEADSKVSYPIADAEYRDGMLDHDQRFLVFEKSDLIQLREYIDQAIKVSA